MPIDAARTTQPPSRRQRAAARRPRLVHVTAVPVTQWQFLRGQNPFMVQRGFDVHAVASPGPLLDQLAARDGVTVHPLPISRTIAPIDDLRSVVRLWRLLRSLNPDIAHVSTSKGALIGAVAARLAGVPIRIYQVRGLASEDARGWRRRLFLALEWLTARLCNAWFVNARSLLAYARATGVLRRQQGTVFLHGMANGIDLVRFDPGGRHAGGFAAPGFDLEPPSSFGTTVRRDRDLIIGYVGRLTRDKGIEDLATAWSLICEGFPAARLLLVGPWEAHDPVSESCRVKLEADARVTILPFQDDVRSAYRAMDLFVYPSHGGEGFPNAPMEAAAMQLPVIVTRVIGSVDAVVDGHTGVTVPPRDPAALADAIADYLQDADRRAAHGRAGRTRVERDFRSEALWTCVYQEYERLLERHGLPVPPIQPATSVAS